jgi:hypothetical protein
VSDQQTTEEQAILALVRPMAANMERLSIEGRITLLCALLAQEMCNLPPSERDEELRRVMREMPDIMRLTEAGMRQALAMNAKEGL